MSPEIEGRGARRLALAGDGVEGIHGVREADEPALCPCGAGYIGHGPCRFVRGVRRRTIRRILPQADRRAERRFRRWSGQNAVGHPGRAESSDLYIEAERLVTRLQRLLIGGE